MLSIHEFTCILSWKLTSVRPVCNHLWLATLHCFSQQLRYIRKDNGLLEMRAKQHFHMAKGAGRLLFGPSSGKQVESPYDTVEKVRFRAPHRLHH